MIGMFVIIGIALVAAGVYIGILAVTALGVRREEKSFSITVDSPDRFARGARVANGAYSRRPGITDVIRRREDLLV